jgi:hypothetical protein
MTGQIAIRVDILLATERPHCDGRDENEGGGERTDNLEHNEKLSHDMVCRGEDRGGLTLEFSCALDAITQLNQPILESFDGV